ncbi:sugar transport [Trichoderma cornu-damae]|uniref:Sugar transport n=1 Tax=Trichoderma cornu-damae TaxID=654480 RepID=A0A9P8QJZ2_9HYPO|nr:sugar transport [Trichoderma cornu-damae]
MAKKKDKEPGAGSAYRSILLAASVPSLIIFSITGVLIGLTIRNRVILNSGLPDLRASSTPQPSEAGGFLMTGGADAYYVEFNPSSLSTIASATGKLTPYLSSVIMGIAAFFAADTVRKASQQDDSELLLSPKQTAVLLGLLSGGFEGLWNAVCFKAKRGGKMTAPVASVFGILAFITILGLVIPAVDTWFGIVVKPVELSQVRVNDRPSRSFGRGLIVKDCNARNEDDRPCGCTDDRWPCDVVVSKVTTSLVASAEASKVLNNVSTEHLVDRFPTAASSEPLLFLRDPASSASLDYRAGTFAVSTQCRPITRRCTSMFSNATTLAAGQTNNRYDCTPGFAGEFALETTADIRFFHDAGLTRNYSSGFSMQNPLYFGTWASMQESDSPGLMQDPDILHVYTASRANTLTWILNCSATVYEASYAWVNGSVAGFNTSLANGTLGGLVSGPFSSGLARMPLQAAAALAGVGNSSADVAASVASSFSHSALSMFVGAVDARENVLEQSRSPVLLTRVPVIPFYVLIVLKLCYGLGTMLFAAAAILWAHPAESAGVKEQLTVEGLVAAIFGREGVGSEGRAGGGANRDEGTKVAVVRAGKGKGKGEWSPMERLSKFPGY